MLQTLQLKMIECTDKKDFLNKIIMLFSHLFNSLKIYHHMYTTFLYQSLNKPEKKRIPGKINHFAVNLATKI